MAGSAAQSRFDIVAFGAHPDDVEMGMGGTVAALTAAGHKVAIVSLTRGELGTHGSPEVREREARSAAEVLGCSLHLLDFPDAGVVADLPSRQRIARLLRELRPATVFTPYPHNRTSHLDGRSNVDHLATGLLVRDGCKLARLGRFLPEEPAHTVRRLFYYMLPDGVRPTYVVDVSDQRERLKASIQAYQSQMAIRKGGNGIWDLLVVMRRAAGSRIGVELGEAFLCEDAVGGAVEGLLQL